MSVAQRRAAPESVDLGLRDSLVAPAQTSTQSPSPPRKSAIWSTISYDAFGDKDSGYTHFPDPTSIAAYNASAFLRAGKCISLRDILHLDHMITNRFGGRC